MEPTEYGTWWVVWMYGEQYTCLHRSRQESTQELVMIPLTRANFFSALFVIF